MPPKPIFDLRDIDLESTAFSLEQIRERNSQRFEMEMLDRINYLDSETGQIVGERLVREDEFWARGHFPGRPVFPGVLTIESAGQLCSFFYCHAFGADKVMGFAACDQVKFRGTVVPGDRLVLLAQGLNLRQRMAKFQTQALVNDEVVFQGQIIGMPLAHLVGPSWKDFASAPPRY